MSKKIKAVKSGDEVMPAIKIRMYPNHLPGHKNTYHARTSAKTLSIEEVCNAITARGNLNGSYNTLVNCVRQYVSESARQLCMGFTISNDYYLLYPNIGGTFRDPHDIVDPGINRLTVRFRPLKLLRESLKKAKIFNCGPARAEGKITEFIDTDINRSNSVYIPGNAFILNGEKIRINENDPECGVFFVPDDDDSDPVKVTRLIENSAGRIIGIVPAVDFKCRVEVRTRYSRSSSNLKHVKRITSSFVLKIA